MMRPPTPGPGENKRAVEFLESVENLELRLIDGYHRIDVALAQGQDVAAWEEFWVELLHRYESLCDGARIAA